MDRKISCNRIGESEAVNCFACDHFSITYNKGFPYGCGAMGFKSRNMPSREVYSSSGIECQSFAPKKIKSL